VEYLLELDLRSRVPIYEQLIDKLKELIMTEVLKGDEQLPSVRELARELTINPNTIQKAYRELERQGYIYSLRGKGNFVSPSVEVTNSKKLIELKEELKKILKEALYLGVKKDEITKIVDEIDELIKGGI